ncbi:MAG: hypothetical protein Kow0032_26170 [Methyloligellaceae bacterium]
MQINTPVGKTKMPQCGNCFAAPVPLGSGLQQNAILLAYQGWLQRDRMAWPQPVLPLRLEDMPGPAFQPAAGLAATLNVRITTFDPRKDRSHEPAAACLRGQGEDSL